MSEVSSKDKTSAQKPVPSAKVKKKVARKYNPIGMHIVQSYELVYHLSFLLNKKKCLIGNVTEGFALNPMAIHRLRKEVNSENELKFLPISPFKKEEDKIVLSRLKSVIGHSVLETMAEPINGLVKLLLGAIAHIDDSDNSEDNIGEILALFQKPIGPPADTNENGDEVQVVIPNDTPYTLVQEIQKKVSILRQRLLLELETIGQLRHQWISSQDCYHALIGSNSLEVRGRLKSAREILTALQAMEILKTQDFKGEFHPKITLDRAIEMMNQWGPGTPPRMFRVQSNKKSGKTIVLNEKLNEQLEILKEATHDALGYDYNFPTTNELIERSKKELQTYYQAKDPSSTSQGITEDESDKRQKEAMPATTEETNPVTGPKSLQVSNHLSYEDILQFYDEKRKEDNNKYLTSLYFEIYCAKYLTHYMITIHHVQDLRGIFTTLQMDLTAAVDLYLLEAKNVAKKIRQITKKLKIQPHPKELLLIVQPGETTRKSLFNEAITKWTELYTKIAKKYVLIELAENKKLIKDSQGLQALCDMETDGAIAYLEQIEALIHAEKEGYISQEQKERYLDPKQTNEVILKSIMAFFSAIEKYDFVKRCELIIKNFQKQRTEFEAEIEADSSKAKALKEPLKQLEVFATETEPKFLIKELLNAEIYNMKPASIFLFIERILLSLELKIEYSSLRHTHEQALKNLVSKLGGSVDVEQYNKLFFTPTNAGESSLLGILNKLNGTPLVNKKNVFHNNDNTMIRECVLRSFELDRQGNPHSSSITNTNVQDLLCIDYCVEIMTYFQFSFMTAIRKVLALDAETKRSEDQSNELGVKSERVTEMRTQCECILDKQVPISFALKQLEAIWQTLEQDKIVAKEAKAIAALQQKLDGNIAGGSSLYNRLGNNPDNVEIMGEYQKKAQAAYAIYRQNLEEFAQRLRSLNKQDHIPKHILEYQRQILSMERSIYQTVEEIKLGAPQAEMLKKQVQEKQKRIHKYKKVLEKYQKDNPDMVLPQIS